MPGHLRRNLDAWQALHPDYEFTLWSDDTLPPLRHQKYFDDPERYSPKSNVGQYRANLARYELLHDLGGVWIDCDLEPKRRIDDLLELRGFSAWELQGRYINNAFMGFEPGHPALARILRGIPSSIERKPRCRSNQQTGVHYITPILRNRADVRVLDQHLVYPYSHNELHRCDEEFPDAIVVHHWDNARRRAMEAAQ